MKKHLKLEPYHLHKDVWLYEEMKGLLLIIQRQDKTFLQLNIPIGKIRQYLKRVEKKD